MSPLYKFIKLFFIIALIVVSVFSIHKSLAADQIVDVSFPCPTGNCEPPADLPSYINTIYQFALGISGLLALGMIVAGGVYYTVSAGNSSRQGDAKSMITSAIWGLVLLFGSYLILNTINPQITKMGLDFSKATSLESKKLEKPLVNQVGCPLFSTIKMNQDIQIKYPGCQYRRNILDGETSLSNDDYYDDNIIFQTSINAGSRVWLYPYFLSDSGVSSAKCLIYAFQEKIGVVNNISTYGSTTMVTLNEKAKLCPPQAQLFDTSCSQWTLSVRETDQKNNSSQITHKTFDVNSSFNYPSALNPPPNTLGFVLGLAKKNFCYSTLCSDVTWTCSAN